MKNSIKILFLLSCVLILSACTNPFKKTEVVKDMPSDMVQEEQRTYSCDDLKNDALRADCENQVSDMARDILYSEIMRTFDSKRCVELSQGMADDCVNTIKDSGVIGPISDAEIATLREAINLTYKTVQGAEGEEMREGEGYYDITKCATFTASGLKEYCEKQLNRRIEEEKVFKIVESGDVTKCDELKDENYRNMCKMELGVEIEEPSIIENTTEPMEATESLPTGEPEINEPTPETPQP